MTISIEHLGAFIVVGAALAMVGKAINHFVFDGSKKSLAQGWRLWFYRTMPAHPVIAGALLGAFADLPSPTFLASSLWGKVLWYALAGKHSTWLYDIVESWAKPNRLKDRHDLD